MKQITSILFLTLLAGNLIAQRTVDALTLSGRFGLPASYENTYNEKATENGAYLGVTYGKVIANKTMAVLSLNHFYFNVQGDPSIPANTANPIILNGTILRVGIYRKFNNGHAFQLLAAPRFMSDYNNPDKNSLQMGALAMYEKDFREDLLMGFGAMFNKELFGLYVVPIVNLEWKLNSRWSIAGMLPIYAKVNYHASDKLTVGFSHFGLVTSYYLGDEDYAGDYMERQSIDLSLFARQRLFWNVFIEGRAGRSFGRNYKQFAGDQTIDFGIPLVYFGDNRTMKNVTFGDGMLFDVRLVLNMTKTAF